ncbi:MAG TPA: Nif3-like dinuclear metal center hexameric protein [Candidatus Salinicoccus stercoripullorum]|uniref:GTP cyclohydrolase 1 type 2 homolog n=1 Tax=Candidatus Salinicoccus stercoripullorum TaxID=2838756 RepID=A0A9D1TZY8_9STAP|nr:Nif3-like dinuclear metal center hexameric protein [Candidatus Salinicoccus stercoripullorum]
MKVHELFGVLDSIAPFKDSEDWDNTGLLVGDMQSEVTGVLTTLDCSMETVEEARQNDINVVVAHHPLIFPKTSSVTEAGTGAIIRSLIKNDINLIAMHTNLDHQPRGVSHMIAERLGFHDTEVLIRHEASYKKLRVNIPAEDRGQLKSDLAKAGVGRQGDYTDCFFEYPVKGQFRPGGDANPHIGARGELENVDEYIVEAIYDPAIENHVVEALVESHPYEEPAFDILSIHKPGEKGLGVLFDYEGTMDDLVSLIEEKTGLSVVNTVRGSDKPIRRVAVIGGSGMSYINGAFARGADVLLTGDVKYHEAYDAKLAGRNIIDTGHYMEHVMAEGLKILIEEQLDIRVKATQSSTNPFS